jgi:aspartyl-tRNA(Asn)/glutamyl-tRNA(Gln) amidotransferase subunit A
LEVGPHTVKEIGETYRAGILKPTALTRRFLDRIKDLNPSLNCFITVLEDSAMEAARQSEERFHSGSPLGPLDGIPVAVKDIMYIKGVRCTAGSKILANNVADYDAPVTRRLKESGAVLLGTTNLHEFAAGVTSVNPHYGPVRNPWDTSKIPGGSSGGSAAAVAAGLAACAIGTDTAGSVRIPAALCGVLGFKPTYGRVSRLGVVPLASSFDTVGTLTSSAWDAAAVFQALAGHDDGDMTTVDAPVPDYLAELQRPLSNARVGVPRKYFHDIIDPEVGDAFRSFCGRLREMGCRVEDVELDGIDEAYDRWQPIRRAEATAFHLRWLETTPELYGEDVRRSLELGKSITAVEYISAMTSRPSLMRRFSESMGGFEAFAVPTTCVPAFTIGDSKVTIAGKEVEAYHALNRLTLPFNLVGFPALSIPVGFVRGLPVGAQLVGKSFDEAGILRIAAAYETKFGAFPSPPAQSLVGTR